MRSVVRLYRHLLGVRRLGESYFLRIVVRFLLLMGFLLVSSKVPGPWLGRIFVMSFCHYFNLKTSFL